MINTLGIFGGTFDPVHLGHLAIAQHVLQECPIQRLHFMPCKKPVLKQNAQATAEQRVAMLQLALTPFKQMVVDTTELDRATPSYTLLTLHQLQQRFPNTALCLILGMDAFAGLTAWYEWQSLLDNCHMVIIDRGDYANQLSEPLQQLLATHSITDPTLLTASTHGAIYRLTMPLIDIASRVIRQRIANNVDVRAQLPEAVYDYINFQRLYHQ